MVPDLLHSYFFKCPTYDQCMFIVGYCSLWLLYEFRIQIRLFVIWKSSSNTTLMHSRLSSANFSNKEYFNWIWLGKIFVNNILFAKFAKVFHRQILRYMVINLQNLSCISQVVRQKTCRFRNPITRLQMCL